MRVLSPAISACACYWPICAVKSASRAMLAGHPQKCPCQTSISVSICVRVSSNKHVRVCRRGKTQKLGFAGRFFLSSADQIDRRCAFRKYCHGATATDGHVLVLAQSAAACIHFISALEHHTLCTRHALPLHVAPRSVALEQRWTAASVT